MKEFHQYPFKLKFHKHYLEKTVASDCTKLIDNHNTQLALSFGKDSMCILHILHKYDLLKKLKLVMFNNSGFEAEETMSLKKYVVENYEMDNFVETTVENPAQYITEEKLNDFVYNVLEIPRWRTMDAYNINATIIGLRASESKARQINFAIRGKEYYAKREKAIILQPLARWTVADVFSYSYTENIPMHPVYERSRLLGFDYKETRVNTLIDFSFSNYGRITKLKVLFPKEYRLICEKFEFIRRLS
jgi:3'-phosphoadenosine 5'-phosphosulfate sulfotransferase (PAPS reductase)/FAD synthetase